ncbi:MAG: hypothetical protein ACJA1A_003032 [Saprospiraceae bacterium]|jgi:hypothetical protein|tara:strand:+ start:259 stop:1155 length:897 start_codon:yes stop_codon:yes gene_type:complete
MNVNFKIIFFFTFNFLFFTNLSTAQKIQEHSFVGTIQLLDNSMITYKIEFDEMKDGSISGKSITDFSGAHRTESEITGSINREQNTITFNELSNLTTKSDSPSDDFCYVHLYNAKIKLKGKKSLIQGHFYSRYENGEKCIEGDLFLMGGEYFFEKAKDVSNKKLVPKDVREKLKKSISNSKENSLNTVLKEDDNLTIIAEGDNLMVRVWEDEYLDGDKVSVYVDDKPILKGYLIKSTMKQLLVPILKDTTILRIVADNEGRLPPNSANFIILNSETEVPIKLQLNEGKEATIQILRKQ